MRFGLKALAEYGLLGVLVKSDFEQLIMAIKGTSEVDFYTTVIIDDIRSIADKVQCTDFIVNRCNADKVAHSLAHFGSSRNFLKIWIGEVPRSCNRFILVNAWREHALSL